MAFDTLLRERIGPRLRELGLAGSGPTWLLPDETRWVQLGFQKSRGNTADRQRVTVNLSVIGKDAWERARAEVPRWPARPKPNATYALPGLPPAVRIAELMPGPEGDLWWEFPGDGDGDGEATADALCAAIADYALPWLRARAAEPPPGG
ncbi:DUF4304 domain-containing protein [Streptomyces sp. NPDC094032]|uniref:DUF4304 domain-containing protein n=1 Tax=Streptomyces sp. NPDC094032 TaxID=3155308 RepID=UPI00331809CD